jgi:hypothetical protein
VPLGDEIELPALLEWHLPSTKDALNVQPDALTLPLRSVLPSYLPHAVLLVFVALGEEHVLHDTSL